jgi:hypothetical protein
MSELKRPLDEKWRTGKGATRDNGGGQLATKGPDKGKRKEGGTGKDPVRRKMTSNNRKMTFRQQKTTKLGPNWPKRQKLQKTPTFKHTVQNCANM